MDRLVRNRVDRDRPRRADRVSGRVYNFDRHRSTSHESRPYHTGLIMMCFVPPMYRAHRAHHAPFRMVERIHVSLLCFACRFRRI